MLFVFREKLFIESSLHFLGDFPLVFAGAGSLPRHLLHSHRPLHGSPQDQRRLRQLGQGQWWRVLGSDNTAHTILTPYEKFSPFSLSLAVAIKFDDIFIFINTYATISLLFKLPRKFMLLV